MLNIAIDGMAGAGKSQLAKDLAESLNIYHFNTGNVYRSLACHYLATFGNQISKESIKEFVNSIKVDVVFKDKQQICYVNGQDYTKDLRTVKTSTFTAEISPYVKIRNVVRAIQRDFAKKNDCVMEGRDIGRVVLPDASYKFFLTASVEERAKRRFKELSGKESYEEILKSIQKRDFEDINREEGALIPADNAIKVDTSYMTIDEMLRFCQMKIGT